MPINLANMGYDDVPAAMPGEFQQLPAGGYVCNVILADITHSKAGNLMLVLFIDIAQGDFKGHFKAAVDRVKSFAPDKKWDSNAIYRQLICDNSGRISKFFKGLMTAFQKSNNNFRLNLQNFDANDLRGLLIGFVFAEEEYQKKDGSIASKVIPVFPKSLADIQSGNFTVPLKKSLQPSTPAQSNDIFGGSRIDPSDLPF